MKLIFELKDNKHMNIINEKDGRVVGEVFTPSGTSKDKPDAIQVCGFSRAFEHWGCGKKADFDGKPLQDIQLLFKDFKSKTKQDMKGISFAPINMPIMDKDGCDRCFHWKDNLDNCKCSDLKVFRRYKDIAKWEKRKKRYETKEKIIGSLEDKK